MRLLKLLVPLACANCIWAATAKYVVLPSGERGYSIRCDNDGMNSCYEMAGSICQHGYAIMTKESQAGFESNGSSTLSGGSGSDAHSSAGYVEGSSYTDSRSTSANGIMVQCKDPEEMQKHWEERVRLEDEAAQKAEAQRQRESTKAALSVMVMLGVLAVVSIGVLLSN